MSTQELFQSYQVFLSHGAGDKYIVEQLLAPKLEKAGVDVFVDRIEIKYGDDFRETIFDELNRSDELLMLLTPTSILRPWVFAELGAAITKEIRVVALVYGVLETELQSMGILSILGTNHFLVIDDFDQYLEQLEERINGGGND